MKQLTKLKLNDASKLSSLEMKRIAGGATQAEYCAEMSMQLGNSQNNNWSTGAYEGWWYGWSNNCM